MELCPFLSLKAFTFGKIFTWREFCCRSCLPCLATAKPSFAANPALLLMPSILLAKEGNLKFCYWKREGRGASELCLSGPRCTRLQNQDLDHITLMLFMILGSSDFLKCREWKENYLLLKINSAKTWSLYDTVKEGYIMEGLKSHLLLFGKNPLSG